MPLARREIERFYSEYRGLGRLIGVRERDLPPTWNGFRAYFDDTQDDVLARTVAVERVLRTIRHAPAPPVPVPDMLWRAARLPAGQLLWLGGIGLVEPRLRARLGISWSLADEAQFRLVGAAVAVADARDARATAGDGTGSAALAPGRDRPRPARRLSSPADIRIRHADPEGTPRSAPRSMRRSFEGRPSRSRTRPPARPRSAGGSRSLIPVSVAGGRADGAVAGYAYAVPHRSGPRTGGRPTSRSTSSAAVSATDSAARSTVGSWNCWAARAFRSRVPGSRFPTTPASACTRRCGFKLVGVYRRIGWKHGAWHDVGWWQRS